MFKHYFYIIAIIFSLQSCTSNESETLVEEETSSSTTTLKTKVILEIKTSENVLKENYVIMMFDQVFKPEEALPTAIKQITSDAKGIALFDLDDLITSSSEKTYYFEAFEKTSEGNYSLKSKFRTVIKIKKDSNVSTSIIVN